jgi:Mn2+/Fe2+ NRAMP family transporter
VTLLLVANTVNIGVDIGAMADAANMITGINFSLAAIIFTSTMIILEVFVSYHRYAYVLRWLVLSLLTYLLTALIVRPDWLEVARAIAVPRIDFNLALLTANVAIIGTTISPYLFFWQSSQEIEEERDRKVLSDRHAAIIREEVRIMRSDVIQGMSIANLAFLFIIVSTFVGMLMNFIGVNPITALYYTAVVNGLVASVLLVFIFMIGNDPKIMGTHTNPLWVKIFGTIATLFMGISSLVLIGIFILGGT